MCLRAGIVLFVILASACVDANPKLVGRAVLPADTFALGPTSGQFIEITNRCRPPFISQQPVQGFSSVLNAGEGRFWALADNGFGAKTNSADYVLRIYSIRPDFVTGHIIVESFITLRDPNGHISFEIVADRETYPNGNGTMPVDPIIRSQRLLTGADFDVESFRCLPDGTFYIGEEFGPFLLHVDATGKLLRSPIPLPGVVSPDHPAPPHSINLPRSRGFEGMAMRPDGKLLYPMLEGPIANETHLSIREFDTQRRCYTDRQFRYRLDPRAKAIGEFTLLTDTVGLVIERDSKQGNEARFKKVFQIDLSQHDANGFLHKLEVVDLLNIPDPDNVGGLGNGVFTFPFWTIESVVLVRQGTIGIINDNNYPFSIGRHVATGEPDDTEFILIQFD